MARIKRQATACGEIDAILYGNMTLPLGAAEDNTEIKIGRGSEMGGRGIRAKEKKMDSHLRGNDKGIAGRRCLFK